MTALATRLQELLAPVVGTTGTDLEDVQVSQAGRRSVVRVVIDREGGLSLDDVADLSRLVSDALDDLDEAHPDLLGPSYVLEVTSPGVERPLTLPRHWRRNARRLVTVAMRDGSTVTGRLIGADDDAVTLEVDGAQRLLPFTQVVRGTVQVEFSRPAEEGES